MFESLGSREEAHNGGVRLQNAVLAYTPWQRTPSTAPLLARPGFAPYNDSPLGPQLTGPGLAPDPTLLGP